MSPDLKHVWYDGRQLRLKEPRQDTRRVLRHLHVERAQSTYMELALAVLLALLIGGGLLWWANLIAEWIA